MLGSLPIGVYVAGGSLPHRLRARTKLLALAWLALIFFFANHRYFHFGVYATTFAVLGVGYALARISPRYVWRRMRLLLLFLALGLPFTLAWTPGTTWRTLGPVQVGVGPLSGAVTVVITYDGLWVSISFTAIFLLLYLGSMLLTLTTSPVALAEGVVLLLRPLRRLGVPADEFGLMTLICLRFIPVLLQEADQLIKAQVSRGADFTTGSPLARLRGISTLLVPLITGALRRAEGLAAALEARGYGAATGNATLLHEGRLRALDWLVLLLIPTLTVLAYLFL